MPLRPIDVRNASFTKSSFRRRGYDADEVDAFLGLVESELIRVGEENTDLAARNSMLGERIAQLENQLRAAGIEPLPAG